MEQHDEIRSLYREIKKINERLDHLEGRASIPSLPQVPEEDIGEVTAPDIQINQLKPPTLRPRPAPNKEKLAFAKSSSSTGFLMGAIGSICFILGAALIVRLAIDAGWLTPFRQWGLVGLLGISLCALSFSIKNKDEQYLGYLAAAGIVILYFSSYSGHLVFEIYEQYTSIGFVTATTCFALWLHYYFKNDFFALTAAAGTYLAPLLLGNFVQNFEIVASYFFLWTTCFSLISFSMGSRVLNLLAAYLGIGIFALINLRRNQPEELIAIILVQAFQFIIISSSITYYSLKFKQALSAKETSQYFPLLLFFYATEYFFIHKWSPTAAPWISIGFALFLLFLSRLARIKLAASENLNSGRMAYAFSAIVFFHCVYLNLLPKELAPYLVMLILLAYVVSHLRGHSTQKNLPVVMVFALIAIIEFSRICRSLFHYDSPQVLYPVMGTILSMFITYALVIKKTYKSEATLFLYIIHFLVVVALYQITKEWGSLAVTLSWGFYSTLILTISYKLKDWILNKSSVFVLLLAGLKALLYDAANAPTEIRILCLLGTGILLYAAGYLFRKISLMSVESER